MIPGITAQGVRVGGGGGGDPHFANVQALLHFDSDFTDVKGHTFTPNGSAAISATQSRFGGASMRNPGSGSYLRALTSTDFGIGTLDYTIEFFVRMDAVSSTQVLFDMRPFGSGGAGPMCTLVGSRFDFYLNSAYRIQAGTCIAATWHHVAVTRAGTTARAFVDGVQIGSDATDAANYPSSQNILLCRFSDSGSFAPTCYIDEFRFTRGVARYTSGFTPPAAPFPNS